MAPKPSALNMYYLLTCLLFPKFESEKGELGDRFSVFLALASPLNFRLGHPISCLASSPFLPQAPQIQHVSLSPTFSLSFAAPGSDAAVQLVIQTPNSRVTLDSFFLSIHI